MDLRLDDVIHVVYEREAYGFGLVFDGRGRLKGALTPREVRAFEGHLRVINPKLQTSFPEPWQERAIGAFNRYFGRCFRSGSPLTDSYESFSPYFREMVGKRIEGRVLDLGSGGQQYLGALGAPVVGCDIALPSGSGNKTKRFVAASGLRLPFRASSFSLIVCLFVLEHVSSPEEVLGEITRLLTPGGRALLAFPSERPSAVLAAKALRHDLPLTLHHLRSFGWIPHRFVASTGRIRKRLEADGCRVRSLAVGLRSPRFLGSWLRKIYPFCYCGSQTILLAEKI